MTYALVVFLCSLVALEGSSLKTLNVAAVDAGGQPVTDLRAQDFQIQEDGKAQKLAYFRFTGGTAIKEVLIPGEYSNRTGVPSQVTVILVDLISDRFLSGGIIGKEIAETLKKLETGDNVYLYFVTSHGNVVPVHGLPEGSEETPAAEPWTRNAGPILDLAVKKLVGLKPVDDRDIEIRFKMTATALDSVGGQMSQIPGRKNLVWVTHGVQLAGENLSGMLVDFTSPARQLAEKLELAQIAVYTVQQSMQGAGEGLATFSRQMLDVFTSITGGRYYGSDASGSAIQQARQDSRGNYRIGYESDALNANGKHHKIRVTCTRKGVRLETEQDFYALGLTPSADDFERATLEMASENPDDVSEIRLRGSVSRDPGVANWRIDLQIPPEDLDLRQEQGHYAGKVSLNLSTYDAQGKATALRPKPIDLDKVYGPEGIRISQDVPMDAGIRKIRAIAIDKELRAVGSLTIPIGK